MTCAWGLNTECVIWQVYTGYDIWDNDEHIPDFTNCSVSYHGPSAGRACHPKSLVRPLAVDLMNVHFLAGAAPGFEEVEVLRYAESSWHHLAAL